MTFILTSSEKILFWGAESLHAIIPKLKGLGESTKTFFSAVSCQCIFLKVDIFHSKITKKSTKILCKQSISKRAELHIWLAKTFSYTLLLQPDSYTANEQGKAEKYTLGNYTTYQRPCCAIPFKKTSQLQ